MWLADGSKNLVIQIGVFLVYIFLGAIVFQALESHNEEEEREAMLSTRSHFQEKYNISNDDMRVFVSKIEEIVDHGFSQQWVKRWTILGSLFFAGTVVTTIGKHNYLMWQFLSNSIFFMPRRLLTILIRQVHFKIRVGSSDVVSVSNNPVFLNCTFS